VTLVMMEPGGMLDRSNANNARRACPRSVVPPNTKSPAPLLNVGSSANSVVSRVAFSVTVSARAGVAARTTRRVSRVHRRGSMEPKCTPAGNDQPERRAGDACGCRCENDSVHEHEHRHEHERRRQVLGFFSPIGC
jgi:hypothetical protein